MIFLFQTANKISELDKYLLDNFGFIGLVIMVLAAAVVFLANYIFRAHKQDKKQWSEERKEWRQTLDKNSDILQKNTDAVRENTSVNFALKTLLETLIRRE